MSRVLVTAFEPYDRWDDNSSWHALVDLTRWYDGPAELTTRRYAVDLDAVSRSLRGDLQSEYDLAIHLGQSPGSATVRLEDVALNLRTDGGPLLKGAPEAYRTGLPLEAAAAAMVADGIPAEVSRHAGTYLCNASLYLSRHYAATLGMPTRSVFVHLPLTPGQAARECPMPPSMSPELASRAVGGLIESLLTRRA